MLQTEASWNQFIWQNGTCMKIRLQYNNSMQPSAVEKIKLLSKCANNSV